MAKASSARLDRVAFKTSRLLDFVGRRELTAQIGHEPALWPLVALKELLDNALDAAEEAEIAPQITVEILTESGKAMISVTDNGPGMAAETVNDILDFSTRTSSREAYCSPTRGAQGNALKTIVAIPYALDSSECGEIQIESRGVFHRITFSADAVRQVPRIDHETEPVETVKNGASITVFWPDSACSYLEEQQARFLQICAGYAVLNPHLTLTTLWDGEVYVRLPSSNESWQKWRACEPTSTHWYTAARLARYAAAHVARDEDRGQSRTVRDFISEFRGLSSTVKQKAVLEETGLTRQPLAALFSDGEVDEESFAALLAAMNRHTRAVKPHDLGVVGRDHLLQFCIVKDALEETFRYRVITGETRDGISFVVEAVFAAAPDSKQTRCLVLGVNFAAALGNPFRSFGGTGYYDGLETRLAEQRCGRDEPVVVILHLACARVEYQDRGKSAMVLDTVIADAINGAVDTVTGPWAKQRKAEERDASRRARRLDRLVGEPHRVTLKEAAWQVMREAYMKASDNGCLPTKPRQIMYAARPGILELTGKDTLDDAYFTQTLLPDYMQGHPDECTNWDVVWDARGTFTEPHTGREFGLGTLEVRRYLGLRPAAATPAATVASGNRFETHGPEHRFDTVLYIEKEGFGPLFDAARLAERFDIAIASNKGMSVTATRLLFDRLIERGVKRILVLHDFDISGFSIFGTLGTSSRRYRYTNDVPLIDLGLRLAQIEAMGLESEPVIVTGDWGRRAATLKNHGASAAEIAFLPNRRVEINAMTSRQLVDFVEAELNRLGVDKVIPDDDILERHARHVIEQRLAEKAFAKLRPKISEEAQQAPLPSDLRARLQAEFARSPDGAWDSTLAMIVAHLVR